MRKSTQTELSPKWKWLHLGITPKETPLKKWWLEYNDVFLFGYKFSGAKNCSTLVGKFTPLHQMIAVLAGSTLQKTNISFFPRHSWRWWLALFPTGRWDMYPSFPGGSGHHFRLGETSPPPWSPGQVLNRRSGVNFDIDISASWGLIRLEELFGT